jgi:PAS domain-containing protein
MVLALHLIAVVACLALLARVALRTASAPRGWFLSFLAAVSWWAVCVTVAGVATSPSWYVRLSQLSFAGIVAVPVLWVAFVDAFVGTGGARRKRVLALAVVPALTLVLALADANGPVVAGVRTAAAAGPSGFELLRGPWYWFVHLPYSYALLLLGVARMLAFSHTSTRRVRQQVAVVVAAILLPLLANVGERLDLLPASRLEITVVAFTLAAALIAWALSARRFLELAPSAYLSALERAGCVLVVDARGYVVDANRAAARLFGLDRDDRRVSLGLVLPSLAAALRRAPEAEGEVEVFTPNLPSRLTRVHVQPVAAPSGTPAGHVLTIFVTSNDAPPAAEAHARPGTAGSTD